MNQSMLFNFLHDHRGLPFRSMEVFNYLLEAAVLGGVMILLLMLARRLFADGWGTG